MNGLKPHRKRQSYSLAISLVVLFLLLSFSTVSNLFSFRSLLQAGFYPFQWVTVASWRFVVETPGALFSLRNLSQENQELQQELNELKPQMALLQEQVNENNQLRALLNFKQNRSNYRLIPAQIIGKSPSPWFTVLEIDQGLNYGLKVNQAVIAAAGLVGRVVEVSQFSAKVLAITDSSSSVAALDSSSRDFGVVAGLGFNKLALRYVATGGQVKPGDKILTSPVSEFYPAGLLIGTVTSVNKKEQALFYSIKIQPAVNFSQLEAVFVLL